MPHTPTGVDHPGIYFSGDPQSASSYAHKAVREGRGLPADRRVISAHLRMNNPHDITNAVKAGRKAGLSFTDAKRKALASVTADHDGIIFRGDAYNPSEYVVFHPGQVQALGRPYSLDHRPVTPLAGH